jgi:hypothetical protein
MMIGDFQGDSSTKLLVSEKVPKSGPWIKYSVILAKELMPNLRCFGRAGTKHGSHSHK